MLKLLLSPRYVDRYLIILKRRGGDGYTRNACICVLFFEEQEGPNRRVGPVFTQVYRLI